MNIPDSQTWLAIMGYIGYPGGQFGDATPEEVNARFEAYFSGQRTFLGTRPEPGSAPAAYDEWLLLNLRSSAKHFRAACMALIKAEMIPAYERAGGQKVISDRHKTSGEIAQMLGDAIADKHGLERPKLPVCDSHYFPKPMA